jgi:hypothetical protein
MGKGVMKPVYKPGTTRDEMISDGWSRQFLPEQTIEEMAASGEIITKKQLLDCWSILTQEMETYFRNAHLEDKTEFAADAPD